MQTRILLAFFVLCSFVVAQESEPVPPQPPIGPRTPVVAPLRGMNPAAMLRMRDQMTFELQQIQRQLGFIDPRDEQLQKTLKDAQADLLAQLKGINAQLKEQGVPSPDDAADVLAEIPRIPAIPPGVDPTLIPGGSPQPSGAFDPVPAAPRNPLPTGMMGGIVPGMPGVPPGGMAPIPGVPAMPPRGPTEFDQDQAWADSPWAPKPSKELAELKQTVDGLRRELGEMRETVKALETQIQLLNRNILLMNPPTTK